MNVVFFGGGTGEAHMAAGAAEFYKANPGIVTTLTFITHLWDDGGNCGDYMRKYGLQFGFGDSRNVIIELGAPWMNRHLLKMMRYRFDDNVCPGNTLMAAALLQYKNKSGNGIMEAIKGLSDACKLPKKFRVIPVSLDPATLVAHLKDGTTIVGQANITAHHDAGPRHITSIELVPPSGGRYPQIYEGARDAILKADLVVVPPGSPRTSLEPPTKTEGFLSAIDATNAKIAMVCNILSKEHTESATWSSAQHIHNMRSILGRLDQTYTNNNKSCVIPLEKVKKGWKFIHYEPLDAGLGINDHCEVLMDPHTGNHSPRVIQLIFEHA